MKLQRLTTTATLMVLAVLCVLPTVASAGPLLSGYGGPGQGNQAILGSALVNGGSGGGTGSGGRTGGRGSSSVGGSSTSVGGEGAAGAGTATSSAGTAPRSTTGASAGAKGGAPAAASHSIGKAGRPLAGNSSAGTAASARSSTLSASRGGAGGSQPMGLSGADLLYMLLAFGALVFTGLLTRSLASEQGGSRRDSAKAMRRRTRVSS